MDTIRVLRPKEGHYLDLGFFFFTLFGVGLLWAYVAFDLTVQEGRDAPQVFGISIFIFLALLLLYFRPGRFVVIDSERGISRPLWIMRLGAKRIPIAMVESYSKIVHILDKSSVVGVMIQTTNGKRIRYLDGETPGCSEALLSVMDANSIPEKIPEKPLFG